MRWVILSFLIKIQLVAIGQINYSGYLDKYPIELVVNLIGEEVEGVYCYSKYDEPIVLEGKLDEKVLSLFENDLSGKKLADFKFLNFDPGKKTLEGSWKNLKTNKEYKITLTKNYELENSTGIIREIIQTASLTDKYFKLQVNYPLVTGVTIFEKGTDNIFQQFELECEFLGISSILIGDYNFDGMEDFSIFERSYAGSNTSRLYFLYSPEAKKFFESGFQGSSLNFDALNKKIYEENICCGGKNLIRTEYRIEKNKMVLITKNCFEYDEKIDDYKKVKCDF